MKKISRKDLLRDVKRLVIKIGSGVLTGKEDLNKDIINSLASDISYLMKKRLEIILVSSGAIAAGQKKLGITQRPSYVSSLQALAAAGQGVLIKTYEQAFAHYGQTVAQVLLTRDDLMHRRRYLNARNTIFKLLSWKVLPVINENDTVVVEEIKFGDNDNLSALVSNLIEAQLVINLTNIDGLFTKDPRSDKNATLITLVEKIDKKIMRCAGATPGFLGTGGMESKIKAARKAALAGIPTIIANGLRPGILKDIFAGKEVGTLFLPQNEHLDCRKHWIAFAKSPKGELVIDKGAIEAITRHGKSLLPVGILQVNGNFSVGDAVLLIDEDKKKIAIGMTNYRSGDVKKIMGLNSTEIESELGFKHDDNVVHRDNLVLYADENGEDIKCHLVI